MSGKLTDFMGMRVVVNEGMMRDAWFIRDSENRILACGTVGRGGIESPVPGAIGTTIECGSYTFDLIGRAALANQKGTDDGPR